MLSAPIGRAESQHLIVFGKTVPPRVIASWPDGRDADSRLDVTLRKPSLAKGGELRVRQNADQDHRSCNRKVQGARYAQQIDEVLQYLQQNDAEDHAQTQFGIQYGINTCCLRAPWIMEKDDFRYTLSFGDDLFGGPDWKTMVPPDIAAKCRAEGTVPLLRDAHGRPLKRNFVHVTDLTCAILMAIDNPATKDRLYNISMDEPVDYGVVAAHLKSTRGLPSIDIPSRYHSNWLDNTRAKYELGWRPTYDTIRMIDAAFTYQRATDDPRKVWYPG